MIQFPDHRLIPGHPPESSGYIVYPGNKGFIIISEPFGHLFFAGMADD
jgi:hypothetical protein